MGMVEVARDALKNIPISEVLRERVSLALDRLAEAERQIATLQAEKGGLQAQLERERIDHEQAKKELQRLQELLREEIRLVCDVEFRKGVRTSGKWMPFCPKCHLPLAFPQDRLFEGDRFVIHTKIPAIVGLFVHVPDTLIWLTKTPAEFLRWEGPVAEPNDPIIRVDLVPGAESGPAKPVETSDAR
jgi:hypothetical protein